MQKESLHKVERNTCNYCKLYSSCNNTNKMCNFLWPHLCKKVILYSVLTLSSLYWISIQYVYVFTVIFLSYVAYLRQQSDLYIAYPNLLILRRFVPQESLTLVLTQA